ncbi:30S ribosomal protein S20 [Wohlfahrtiimonas sp. G9077]|uniref:30S ribosomal protein S20 n=1 Tax=Wohlfahrtiimonas sp. G9077 TaxID=1980118 RepID=UPI000B998BCF|nr:30S ribosomal protein S20 [Wohlfahrtiimonas sp. G9077]OYQ73452.1 30S ribosomal protein S20 [Wohlfahrtiimonas sp. G9077]
MANSAQARKRVRQAEKSRLANASYRSMTRTYVKKVLKAIQENNVTAAQDALKKAQGVLDRASNKGLFHKKTTARLVSRLNARIKAIAA